MNDTIYKLAKECQRIKDEETNIKYKKVIVDNGWLDDYTVYGEIDKYMDSLRQLLSLVRVEYPAIYDELSEAVKNYDSIQAANYIVIGTAVDILVGLEAEKQNIGKKIFISHSSKDKDVVKWFVNHILKLGLGIKSEDICCTSIEGMNVRQGEDIRRHIHGNIKSAEYSFLLISKSYKKSAICLNEMGAVWAYDAKVRAFLLPDAESADIGWLNDPNEAKKIDCSVSLDALKDELIEQFSLPDLKSDWSSNRQEFIDNINKLKRLQDI